MGTPSATPHAEDEQGCSHRAPPQSQPLSGHGGATRPHARAGARVTSSFNFLFSVSFAPVREAQGTANLPC